MSSDEDKLKEMPLTAHLSDLRKAIIISVGSVIICALICFAYNERLLKILIEPVKEVQFIFVSPAEAFVASLQLAIWAGLIIALPVVLREIFWFVSPGLSIQEKKMSIPVVIFAYFLFIIGVIFAYYVLLPVGVKFLIAFAPLEIKPMLSIGRYISFCAILILGTGLIFETPLLLLFLSIFGIITGKLLRKQWRYAILISFIIGGLITPSVDVFTQSLMAGALLLLYYISILLVEFREWKKRELKKYPFKK